MAKILHIAMKEWSHPLDCLKAEVSTQLGEPTARIWYDRCPDLTYAKAITKQAGGLAEAIGCKCSIDIYDKPDPIIIRPKVAKLKLKRG